MVTADQQVERKRGVFRRISKTFGGMIMAGDAVRWPWAGPILASCALALVAGVWTMAFASADLNRQVIDLKADFGDVKNQVRGLDSAINKLGNKTDLLTQRVDGLVDQRRAGGQR